jgi:hypothetical protein
MMDRGSQTSNEDVQSSVGKSDIVFLIALLAFIVFLVVAFVFIIFDTKGISYYYDKHLMQPLLLWKSFVKLSF